MANRTDPLARSVHGTNPQNLVEQILRAKIYQSRYWKEECFGLSAETLVDKAVELNHVGGTFGGQRKPTDFMCLVAKMLQIQPDKEIIVEFIKNEDYKYVRLLGAFYLRLVGKALEVYQYLEPLFNDYRKIRQRNADGNYTLTHIDEVIDEMLQSDYMFDIALPRLPSRLALQQADMIEARISVLAEDFDEAALEAEAGEAAVKLAALEAKMGHGPDRGRERDRDRDRERDRDRDRDRQWDRDHRDRRDHSRERDWERDREKDREIKRQRRRSRSHERDRHVRDDFHDRRDRRRSRSRSRDRHRDHDRHKDRERRERGRGERDRNAERRHRRSRSLSQSPPERQKRRRPKKKHEDVDPEIAEQNALRAKLGLKPLK